MSDTTDDMDRGITDASDYGGTDYDDKTWTTKDGRVINICDMDDNHLKNTVAMLERNGKTIPYEMIRELALRKRIEEVTRKAGVKD